MTPPRRMASNRVSVGRPTIVDGGMCACPLAHEGACPPAPPYQPPAEERAPAVEPVALDVGGEVAPVPGSPEPLPALCARVARLSVGWAEDIDDAKVEELRDAKAELARRESAVDDALSLVSPEPVASAIAGEPEPPTVAECVASYRFRSANYNGALAAIEDASAALKATEEAAKMAYNSLARVTDRLARRIDDKQVEIDGEHWRAVRPRKPRGKPVDPAALWTLERVEVAK